MLAQVESDRLKPRYVDPPIGLLSLATVLRRKHSVSVVSGNKQEILQIVKERDPETVGLSFTTFTAYEAYEIAGAIKGKVKLIAGGAHASALLEEALEHFDVVVTGEAESVILDAVESIGIIEGQATDEFVLPAWDLLEKTPNRTIGDRQAIAIETSRGCPFRCAFCNSSVLSKKLRFKPIELLEEELDLLKRLGWSAAKIVDDNFNVNRDRMIQVAELMKKKGFKYRAFAHLRGLTDETVRALVETGCYSVGVGVESCSDRMLRSMRKPQTFKDIKNGLENAAKHGLKTRIFLIVGFPGESWDTVKETVYRLKQVPFDSFRPYACIPYPGTELFAQPEKFGITWISRDWSQYGQIFGDFQTGYVMATKSFTSDDVRVWREWMINQLADRKKAGIDEVNL